MLRTTTFLSNHVLFTRLANSGTFVANTSQHKKTFRPIKGVSTGCDQDPPPLCSNQPCLMDYCPELIGCWQEDYDKKNKKANKDLLLGIVSLIFALIVVDRNGMAKGYNIPLFFPNI